MTIDNDMVETKKLLAPMEALPRNYSRGTPQDQWLCLQAGRAQGFEALKNLLKMETLERQAPSPALAPCPANEKH